MYENIYTIAERKALIADTLKFLRKSKRYTQKEVAEKLGINTEAYATYERGRNEPPAEMLVRLSFLYDVPIDVIVQKDNFTKDSLAVRKQLEGFEEIADEIKSRVLSGDPETREVLSNLADMLGEFSERIKQLQPKDTNKTD